jgi:shikimate kinase
MITKCCMATKIARLDDRDIMHPRRLTASERNSMIVLVGFMGAGKTTIGRTLANRLGLPFADSDDLIRQRAGRSIPEIFDTDGEAYFREREHEVIAEAVAGPPSVLALGGGAVEDARTRALLASCTVIYLEVNFDHAMSRIHRDAGRPMLRRTDLSDIYARRLPLYEEVATYTVAPTSSGPAQIAARLATDLAES